MAFEFRRVADRRSVRCRGEVSERLKERAWKARVRLTPYRGFESHPLRLPLEPLRLLRELSRPPPISL